MAKNRLNTSNTTDDAGAVASDITGTTVGSKRAIDVAIIDGSSEELPFDADSFALTTNASTQDIYTYYTGGVGGTIVGTITINYTDTCKIKIQDLAKVPA